MKLLGIRRGYLLWLLFFVLPVGGFCFYYVNISTGYSVMLSMNGPSPVVESCQKVPDYEEYLVELNKLNKSKNIVCEFSGNLTTMSKAIHCAVMNGPTMAYIYWAETLDECNKIETKIRGDK